MQRQHERNLLVNQWWWNVFLALVLIMASFVLVCHFIYKNEDGEKQQPAMLIISVVVFLYLIFLGLASYPISSPSPSPPQRENIIMMDTPPESGFNESIPASPPPIIRRRVNPKFDSDQQCLHTEKQPI